MGTNETAIILISASALLLSIIATIISVRRSRRESHRIIRSQLTDVLSRIVDTNLESTKIQYAAAERHAAYCNDILGILSQQNASLLQQALYLIEQIPSLVTSIEYGTIATANQNAGDILQAEKYFQKAIGVASNDYYRSHAAKNYGLFLFQHRRFEEGREQYKKSLSLLKGGDNHIRFTKGNTYKFWGVNELNFAGAPRRAEELIESAENEYNGIDNEIVRNNALESLREIKKELLRSNQTK